VGAVVNRSLFYGKSYNDMNHTLGPWKLLSEGDEDFTTRTIIIDGPPRNLREVCIVTTGSFTDDVEKANAQLISVAPELLEALEEVLHNHVEFGGLHNDTAIKVSKVINKARGL
jgi:hypothetical protein